MSATLNRDPFSPMTKFLKDNLLLILILSLGTFLRIWRLGEYSLWKDEIFSMLEAQRSLEVIFTTKTYFFGYAPLHHFFTHLALYFGKSEFIVRFSSVIFGAATIYLIYKLGELFFNKRVGLVSALLLAISTLHLEYSREVRYYSYLIFFSGLTLFFLYKLLLEKKWRWLVLYSVVTVLNMATQATAVLVLISQMVFLGLWFFLKRRKKDFRFTPKLIFVIPFVIATGIFVKSFNELFSTIKLNPAMPFPKFLEYVLVGLSGGKTLSLFYLIFFFLGLAGYFREKKKELGLLLLVFVIPLFILYFLRPQVFGFHIRYVIFILIPYLLLISYAVNTLLKHNVLIFLAVLLFAVFSIQPIMAYYQTKKGDWRGVGQYLVRNAQPGEVVITESYYNKILLDYYLEAENRGLIIKTAAESLTPKGHPFSVYFLQHDYVKEGNPNPQEVYFAEIGNIISFDPQAEISPMYIFTNKRKIWLWQEAEFEWIRNEGWGVSDNYGKLAMGTSSLTSPQAKISYKINLTKEGIYDLYLNLRWDGARGKLRYKIDQDLWSAPFEPFYGEKGQINPMRWMETKIGSVYLNRGEHEITFMNVKQEEHNIYQTIDYFYLSLNE